MDLILTACCKRKDPASDRSAYHPSQALTEGLSPDTFERLMKARRELATLLSYSPGPDLGFDESPQPLGFLPAFRRYRGIVYTTADVRARYPRRLPTRLVVISALYGLLDADDLIRNYDLAMD